MKPIKRTTFKVGGNGPGINTPVPITTFPKGDLMSPPFGDGSKVAPPSPPLPPPPPQMNQPVGPPPTGVAIPSSYEEFMETAVRARQDPMGRGMLWAALAQAAATKQVAERLEDLLVYLGADDATEEGEQPDGPRFFDQISAGVRHGVLSLKDDFIGTIPSEMQAALGEALRSKGEEFTAEMKRPKGPFPPGPMPEIDFNAMLNKK